MRWLEKDKFRLFRGQEGVSLLETVIALALLGIIGATFLGGLTTASKGTMLSQEMVVAESLAKSQVEHIKSQEYISVFNYDPETNYYEVIDIPPHLVSAGYSVEINPPQYVVANGENMTAGRAGFELQSITIVIKLNDKPISELTTYRVGLAL